MQSMEDAEQNSEQFKGAKVNFDIYYKTDCRMIALLLIIDSTCT